MSWVLDGDDITDDLNDQYNYQRRKEREREQQFKDQRNKELEDELKYHEFIADFVKERKFVLNNEIERMLDREEIKKQPLDDDILLELGVVKIKNSLWDKDICKYEFFNVCKECDPDNPINNCHYEDIFKWDEIDLDAVKPSGFVKKICPGRYHVCAGYRELKTFNGNPIPYTFFTNEIIRVKKDDFDVTIPKSLKGNEKREFWDTIKEKMKKYFNFDSKFGKIEPSYYFKNAQDNTHK